MVAIRGVTWIAQLRRGVVEHCVLALLSRGESYGFDLARTLVDVYGLGMGEGTLYPLLARLHRQGLVESRWQASSDGPPRRYYRLTDAGEYSLKQFTFFWLDFKRTVDSVLMEEVVP